MAADAAAATEPAPAPDAPPAPSTGLRLPLALRLFLLAALPLVLVVGLATLATWLLGERSARDALATALDDGERGQRTAAALRLQLLERTARLLAADPAFASGLAAVRSPPGATPAGAGLLRAPLLEARERFGVDLGLVVGAGGTVLARSDGDSGPSGSLADDPLLAQALAGPGPASGFWRHRDQLFQAAVVGLPPGGPPAGFLVLAQRVDDAFSRQVAGGPDAALAWWLPGEGEAPRLVASSLPAAQATALERRFAATPELVDALQLGHPVQQFELAADGGHWLLRAAPIAPGDASLGMVAVLASAAATMQGYRQLPELLLLGGAAALLLAALLSAWLSRRILRPAEGLAEATLRAASGDHAARPPAVAGADAMARLARALDVLLSNLRETRAAQAYLATWWRLLPEPGETEPAAAVDASRLPPARRGERVLLALELPLELPLEPPPGPAPGEQAAAVAQERATRLQALAGACGGRVAAGDGERWLLAFDGPDRLLHALQAARAAMHDPGAEAVRPAAALAEGDSVEASLRLGDRLLPALLGTPGRQLLRLLCESAPGSVLVARPLGERIRERFGSEALAVAAGTLAGRRYYALRADGLERLPAPGAEPGATAPSAVPAPDASGTEPDTLRAGDRIGSRYQLLADLGAGGLGRVYKARDLESADVVALTMAGAGAIAVDGQRERLQDAVRLARRIAHPNVVRTLEYLEVDGRPCVTTEYVRGATLRALLDQSGHVPHAAALGIARQLCAGLAAVHAAGLVHGAIGSGAVVLDPGGTVRLAGPGIAQPVRRDQPAPAVPGRPPDAPLYSAPEQLAGEELDARADIYACGALMSELFCGGLPYQGRTAAEVYLAQVQQEPVRPSALWPEIPPALERVILRCIARRREDRFRNVDELAAALAELRA